MTAQLMSQNLPIVITSSTKSEFWHFHIVVAQRRANKCTKKRDAHAKLLFCLSNLLLFCRSCCCRRRFCLSSLLIVRRRGDQQGISVKQEGERGKGRRISTFSSFSFPSRPLHTSVVIWASPKQSNRPIRITQCCTQSKSPGVEILCVLYFHYNFAFSFKCMEIPETKSFIPKGFELGTTLSQPNWSIEIACFDSKQQQARNRCERKQAKGSECMPRDVSRHSIYPRYIRTKDIARQTN